MKANKNVVSGCLAIILTVFCVQLAKADPNDLYLYDNFDGTGCIHTQNAWTIDQNGVGIVDISGPEAVLNMSRSPQLLSHARIIANNLSLIFNDVGDYFRVTWDMKRIRPDGNGWLSGICIGNVTDHIVTGGLFGECMDGAPPIPPGCDRADTFNFNFSGGPAVPDPNARYHMDLSLELDDAEGHIYAVAKVYDYNALFDEDPNQYESLPPLWDTNVVTDYTVPVGEVLSVRFYAEIPLGEDSMGGGRERTSIAVDNVYTNIQVPITVPDPAESCGDLVGDADDDGLIVFTDLQIMVSEWLDCNLVPPEACSW